MDMLNEYFLDVSWHGYFYSSVDIVSIQVNDSMQSACSVYCCVVFLLQSMHEVLNLFNYGVLDTKIVDDESTRYICS